jgi:hypothetical protein
MLDQAQRRDAGAKLIALARTASQAAEAVLAEATAAVRQRVMVEDRAMSGSRPRRSPDVWRPRCASSRPALSSVAPAWSS